MTVALGLMVVALSLLGPATAPAHSPQILLMADPGNGAVMKAPPAQVVVRFKVELHTAGSRLQVFDGVGRQVDRGNGGVDLHDPDHASLRVSLPSLPDGKYTVRWRAVVLEDRDVVDGALSFTVSKTR